MENRYLKGKKIDKRAAGIAKATHRRRSKFSAWRWGDGKTHPVVVKKVEPGA